MGEKVIKGVNADFIADYYKRKIDRQKAEYEKLMKADSEAGEMLRGLVDSVHEQKGQNEESEDKAEEKIRQYLKAHNGGKEGNEYLVRGAELKCSCGSNKRKMNLNECHGVYIKGHAVVHELDCLQGDEQNITWFGACEKKELDTELILAVGDDGIKHSGKKCKPHIIGVWIDSYDGTKIADYEKGVVDNEGSSAGYNTLTVGSFLVCKYGGIIAPVSSGQEREVSKDEFVYGEEAYNRVMKDCSEEIDEENSCDDLLHAMIIGEGRVHGSAFLTDGEEAIGTEEVTYNEETIEMGTINDGTDDFTESIDGNIVNNSCANYYTEDEAVKFVEQFEGLSLKPYNDNKTIGYGFDYYLRPDITINWNDDGTITQKEAERLLKIMMDECAEKLNKFLEEESLSVDQNMYDALIDLFYNRNVNSLTKEVARAMAAKDDEKVLELFDDFDYRYAYAYLYKNDEEKSRAYVERNPGLKKRRQAEYSLYKWGYQ